MFKAGDYVRCKSGYTTSDSSGGYGYEEGLLFIVGYTTEPQGRQILWVDSNTGGVYADACELCVRESWYGSNLKFNFIK